MVVNKIDDAPFCRDNQNAAFSLSVLQAHTELSPLWLFVHFFIPRFERELWFDLPFFLFTNWFKYSFILYFPFCDITKRLMKALQKGYYVYTEVNEKYIPERSSYGAVDFTHDILVYGYDNKHNFFTIGYDTERIYKKGIVPFNEMSLALKKCKSRYMFKIMKFQVNKKYDFESVQIEQVLQTMTSYLYPNEDNKGILAFSLLAEKLSNKDGFLHLRELRVVLEHYGLLYKMRNIFTLPQDIVKLFSNALKKSEIFFNIAIKYSRAKKILNNSDVCERLIALLHELIEIEKTILTEILKSENNTKGN